MTSIRRIGAASAQTAAVPKAEPLFFPGKTTPRLRGEADFMDAGHWNKLAAQYLARFNLPDWAVPCDPDGMRRWLERLGVSERAFALATATTLSDFVMFNPAWPLRAFVGLALEMRAA